MLKVCAMKVAVLAHMRLKNRQQIIVLIEGVAGEVEI
jgi:hypothetical protein